MSTNAPPRQQQGRQRREPAQEQPSAVMRLSPQQQAVKNVQEELERRHAQLLALVGGDPAIVERLKVVALHALSNPKMANKLARADLATVVEAVRESAVLGLELDGASGQAYLVPYWNRDKGKYDFQFQAGYRGLAKLLVDTVHIATGVVYENDAFDWEQGSEPFLRHKMALANRGNRVAFYAVARDPKTGRLIDFEVMTLEEVERVRASSKAADDGPWVEWFDQMGGKTVLRRLQKRIPANPKAERAMALENEAEDRYSRPPALAEGARPIAALPKVRGFLGLDEGSAAEATTSQPADAPGSASSGSEAAAPSQAAAVEASAEPESSRSGSADVEPIEGEFAEAPAAAAICGADPQADAEGRQMGLTEPCQMAPGHAGPTHRNGEGPHGATWRRDSK